MTEPKRPVGRPRKIPLSAIVEKEGMQFVSLKDAERILGIKPEEEPIKNPDCEPATKAYVKCTLRKLLHKRYEVSHYDNCGHLSFAVSALSALGSLTLLASQYANSTPAVTCYSITILSTISWIEWMWHGNSSITITDSENPKEIENWEPPVCESKRDCE
ncbi:MAG: hypothetical protein PHX61_02565 [Alphaproteobacteria bacterium]|nr:hypothetical protein [Alphaproteobacteria bacterium]